MRMKVFQSCTMPCFLDWPCIQITVTKKHTYTTWHTTWAACRTQGGSCCTRQWGNSHQYLAVWIMWRETHTRAHCTPHLHTQYSMRINLTQSTTFNHMCTTHFRLSSPCPNTDKDINSCRLHQSDASGLSRSPRYPLTVSQFNKSQPTNLIIAFSSQDQQETE